MFKHKISKETGITLIALVVTIIVLLLLAGISIQMLTGDNGILQRAGEAKEKSENVQLEEQVKLSTLAAITNGRGDLTETSLKKELKKSINGVTDGDITGNKKKGWTVKIGDKGYYISPTGDVNEAYWMVYSNGTIGRVDGTVTGLAIGDTINYDVTPELSTTPTTLELTTDETGWPYIEKQTFDVANYTNGWQILGVEKGNLIIIASKSFGSNEMGGTQFALYGKVGYQNTEQLLNRICSLYGKGKYSQNARSINVDDINQITGYDPDHIGVNTNTAIEEEIISAQKYGEGQRYQYGRNIIFLWSDTQNEVKYTYSGMQSPIRFSAYSNGFQWFDGKTWKKSDYSAGSKICTLKVDFYRYYPSTLKDTTSGGIVGITNDSSEYKLLFQPEGGSQHFYYLASKCTRIESGAIGDVTFRVRTVSQGNIDANILFRLSSGDAGTTLAVRPVVLLKPDIKLIPNGANAWKFVE